MKGSHGFIRHDGYVQVRMYHVRLLTFQGANVFETVSSVPVTRKSMKIINTRALQKMIHFSKIEPLHDYDVSGFSCWWMILPSLKLTARLWNGPSEKEFHLNQPLISRAFAASFREGNYFWWTILHNHPKLVPAPQKSRTSPCAFCPKGEAKKHMFPVTVPSPRGWIFTILVPLHFWNIQLLFESNYHTPEDEKYIHSPKLTCSPLKIGQRETKSLPTIHVQVRLLLVPEREREIYMYTYIYLIYNFIGSPLQKNWCHFPRLLGRFSSQRGIPLWPKQTNLKAMPHPWLKSISRKHVTMTYPSTKTGKLGKIVDSS